MDALLGKTGIQLFAKHLEQYAPADPLYEVYTTDKGKQKRRKRAIPPGLSKRDARILRKLMTRAHRLDKGFSVLSMRFGYTFIIGLVPLIGDFADIWLNYLFILRPAQKLDLPGWLLRRMLMNNAVSAGVGLVPFVGDVFLANFKANSRNVALVEEFLRIRGEEFIRMGGVHEEDQTGWSWFGKGRKTNNANTQVALSKNDVEQVKPGAGMTGDELKDSLVDVPPPPVGHIPKSGKTVEGGTTESTTVIAPSTNALGSSSSSRSSGFSFFGTRSRKSKTPPLQTSAPEPLSTRGDKGKFVEDLGGMPGALPH